MRATVGEGEIVVRNDEETGTDSTAGLNRDTSKAYEITRDEEERTDLYASKSSVEAVANPGKTLQAWGEALVNYDEQAKANFEQLGVLANASLNELEKLTGRTLAEGAVKAGGAEIAEQTLYGLIMSGMSLDAAKALLANQAFQEQVLANLNGIDNVFSATPDLLKTVERGLAEANLLSLPDVVVLPEQEVTPGALRPEQAILGRVSDINAYLEAHPDQAEAVGFVLAAAQGPKGLLMWAASQALADTPFAEQVAQYQAYLKGILGKAIAEGVEGHDLDASYDNDAYLLGGGGLIGTLLVGAVGSKAGKAQDGNSSAVNHNPHSGRTDAEAGTPYEHPVKVGEATKGTNRLPVPDDLPTNIHMGQQGKHIKGHNNFQEGRSYFNDGVDPAELLSGVHSGQYPVVGTGARGNPIVDFGKPIGVDGRTGQIVTKGQIHYGSNGAHIVPDARN